MIKSFKHKGLEVFYRTGSTKGIRLCSTTFEKTSLYVEAMTSVNDLKLPSLRLHKLKGDMAELYSITVQANWRLTFKFDEETQNVYIVDYQDYH